MFPTALHAPGGGLRITEEARARSLKSSLSRITTRPLSAQVLPYSPEKPCDAFWAKGKVTPILRIARDIYHMPISKAFIEYTELPAAELRSRYPRRMTYLDPGGGAVISFRSVRLKPQIRRSTYRALGSSGCDIRCHSFRCRPVYLPARDSN